jgi:hypothetical protein
MSLPDASSSPQALLWNAFRTNPASDEDLYLPDTHIVFLPTGAGAAGEHQVRDFFKAGGFSHSKKLAVEETVIHRTVGESSAVDEVAVTVKFVSGAGGWLLPSVEPHHLEDLTITFPLVSRNKASGRGRKCVLCSQRQESQGRGGKSECGFFPFETTKNAQGRG